MTLNEALFGKEIPLEVRKSLTLVTVPHLSFGGEVQEGQLVIHTTLAAEVQEIFQRLCELRFPIQQIVPIVTYQWDDDASMKANNTSAFNYRVIAGTNRLSNHSYGRAIDINPVQNPYVRGISIAPPGAVYNTQIPGTVTEDIAQLFKECGWSWGGEWKDRKDWQHFEKPMTN